MLWNLMYGLKLINNSLVPPFFLVQRQPQGEKGKRVHSQWLAHTHPIPPETDAEERRRNMTV
ncbi:hypothetical protein DMO16_17880 [Fictibacillus sp. S7]|nr:hypothetical protein DMO16_17880 [Fictibacillus sp. S7]